MKFIIKLFFLFSIIVGISEPVFAMQPAKNRPVYYREYNYVKDNHCNAVAMIPYSGDVLYECSSGETFWSDVLVATEKSPLFMYFKNRKHEDDDNATDTATYSSFSYY